MFGTKVTWIRSLKTTHFTTAIAAGAKEDENLTGLSARGPEFKVVRIVIVSTEQKAWEVQFYGNDLFASGDADTEKYLGSKLFAEGDGQRVGGAGLYKYDSGNLSIFYKDFDASGELHISLANRSATAKTVDAGGYLAVLVEVQG